ncbi:hypothetical protein [Thioflexithrix psekupsensis]|uniref:Uncharacterized protein n=1 Tax=Thioflexithrix psekupsensis TaxID=1570016 RepID=A0A251X3U4_9GAMM|nr:hypothetical protein [Thioflexithrix psekupsensis]OUD12164.1 hypothetical protein TPSD3_13640 [Thioflexithrix psekupsensis]
MEEFVIYAQKNLLPLVPLVFVLVALSQLLISILGRLLKRTRITVYPTSSVDLTFNQHGATVTLSGSFYGRGEDVLVTHIDAIVTHQDQYPPSPRTFEWRAFKPYLTELIYHNSSIEPPLEPVAPFILSTKATFKYQLLFVDDAFLMRYSEEAQHIRYLWQKQQPIEIDNFLMQPELRALQQRFLRDVGWQAGTYQLCLRLYANHKQYEQCFYFALTPSQIHILQSNFEQIIRFICQQPSHFAYVRCPYLNQ